jgi:hypothetical protein
MTTLLQKPLSRELLLGDDVFKVVISLEGVRLTLKGHRKGIEITWDNIVAIGRTVDTPRSPHSASTSDMPQAIAADVAREVRAANAALARASSALARAGTLPAALLAEIDPDPVHGRPDRESDWFVEPLLTVAEVASILRLSRSAVVRLPIPSLMIAGERRYRQSELRRYLAREERRV